ncbi:MAG: hypothetical protein ACOYIK_00965 [Coriobacteriales bacterium]|jgi:hypothetical protein
MDRLTKRNRACSAERLYPEQHYRDPFVEDDGGFTTLAVAVSLLLVLALLFSAVQVEWVESRSPDIQFAADAGALAASNVVADYYTVARVADAMVLSMSVLALSLFAVVTVLCCIPVAAALGAKVMQVARKISSARDRFSQEVSKSLNALQSALPFLCAANAAAAISANSNDGESYLGIAIPLPLKGEKISVPDYGLERAEDEMEENNEEVSENTSEAEECYERMESSKLAAYMADCGNNPSYCMYQRAKTLASLDGYSNPYHSTVDTWSFSVALDRARNYYSARLSIDAPDGSSVKEKVRSNCRRVFYEYAVDQLETAYVHEPADGRFEAYFPLMPVNTDEMRQTEMYTAKSWPVSGDGKIHGTADCPSAQKNGISGMGSLQQLESGTYSKCPECGFSASSLGKVGAASSKIDNGFEYYYRIVAEQASLYQSAQNEALELEGTARESASRSFNVFVDALKRITGAGCRITPNPPGRYGCIAMVVDLKSHEAPSWMTPFVGSSAEIPVRAAISASKLGEDDPDESGDLLSSMFKGVIEDARDNGNSAIVESGLDWVFSLWSKALLMYNNGVDSLSKGIEDALDSLPMVGDTGLGSWAKDKLLGVLDDLGLQPVELSSLKPVLVNSAEVLEKADVNLSSALSIARGLLNLSEMPDDVTFKNPLGNGTITVDIPEPVEDTPSSLVQTLEDVLEKVA